MKLLIRSIVVSACSMFLGMSAGAAAAAAAVETTAGGTDWNQVIAWAAVASTLFSLGSGIYTWLSNRDRVTAENFAKQHKEFTDRCIDMERQHHKLELKVTQLEGTLKAVPTMAQMGELYSKVGEVDGDMKAANATLAGIQKSVENFEKITGRIENFLLEQAQDKGRKR